MRDTHGAPGELLFVTPLTNTTSIAGLRIYPHGQLLVWDRFPKPGWGTRINTDGQIDPMFQATPGPNANIWDVAVQSDGKLILAGSFDSVSGSARNKLARLNFDGSPDPSFKAEFGPDALLGPIAVQPDGKILVFVSSATGTITPGLVRLSADGSSDDSFRETSIDTGLLDEVSVTTSGPAILRGQFLHANNLDRFGVALIQTNGAVDLTFTPDKAVFQKQQAGFPLLHSAVMLPDGRVLLGGLFDHVGSALRTNVAILQRNGRLDLTFNAGSIEGGNDAEIEFAASEQSGKVLVLGSFNRIAGQGRNGLARLLPDGTLDTSYISGLPSTYGIALAALMPDDTLAVAGDAPSPFLARLKGGEPTMGPPQIAQDASGAHVRQGQDVDLSVVGKSALPMSYQWYFNGAEMEGATNVVLPLHNLQPAQSGAYFATVANTSGVATGQVAVVLVDPGLIGPAGGDASFQPGTGADGEILALAVQPDGKTIVGGDFKTFNGAPSRSIARLNPNGSLDASFASAGSDGKVRALLLQADGKIVVGGNFSQFNGAIHPNLVRLNSDGSLDPGFRIGSGPSSQVYCLAAQADGQILVGGGFKTVAGLTAQRLARLQTNGIVDANFSTLAGVNGLVSALAVQEDGRILIGGTFNVVGGSSAGVTRMFMARLLPDGSPDWEFNPGWGLGPVSDSNPFDNDDWVRTIVPLPSGEIVVGGRFSRANDERRQGIVKLSARGEVMPEFFASVGFLGEGWADPVSSIVVKPDGSILLGLLVTTDVNGRDSSFVAALNPDGSVNPIYSYDRSFGGGATDAAYANSLALLPNGSLVIAGKLTLVDGLARNGIARYAPPPEVPRGAPDLSVGIFNSALPSTNVLVDPGSRRFKIQAGEDVLLAGSVTSFEAAQYQWESGGVGIPGATNPVLRLSNVRSWAGDPLRLLASNSAGVSSSRAVTLNVSVPFPMAGHVDTSFAAPGPINGKVRSLALQADGKVLVAGSFTTVGGSWRPLLARLNTDGQLDSFDPGWSHMTGIVSTVTLQTNGAIVLGGDFWAAHAEDGRMDKTLIRLLSDGSRDLTFKPQFNPGAWIWALAIRQNGNIAVGGSFESVNDQPQQNLSLLNPDGTLSPEFLATADGQVNALVWQPDGKLLIGGAFTEVDGNPEGRVARLNSDGSLDQSFNSHGGADDEVDAIALQPDGKILLAGKFSRVGVYYAPGLARLNTDGSADIEFTPDIDNSAINDVVIQSDGKLLIAGDITAVDGTPREGIARLYSDGSLDGDFDSSAELTLAQSEGTGWKLALDTQGNVLMGGYFNAVGATHRGRVVRLFGQQPAPKPAELLQIGLNQTARAGDNVLLTIPSQSQWPVAYQWYKDAGLPTNAVAGGTNQALSLQRVGSKDAGVYLQLADIQGAKNMGIWFPDVSLSIHAATDLAGLPESATFSQAGADRAVFAILRRADRILVGGTFTQINGQSRNALAQLKLDGSTDAGFDLSSVLTGTVLCLTSQRDTNVLVGGHLLFADGTTAHLVRLLPDGSVDPTFRVQANTSGEVRSVAVAHDGTLFVGGAFETLNGTPLLNIARLHPDGSLHPQFAIGSGPDGPIDAVAEDSAGGIWLAGRFAHVSGRACPGFARIQPTGQLDAGFQPASETTGFAHAVVVRPDGRVVLGGRFSRFEGTSILGLYQFDPSGAPDLSPAPLELVGASDEVVSLAVQADNQLIVAGRFGGLLQGVDSLVRHGIARLGSDGQFDRTFDPASGIEGFGQDAVVHYMQVEPEGAVLIGGGFSLVSGLPRSGIARLLTTNSPVSEIRRPPAFLLPATRPWPITDTTFTVKNWYIDAPDANPGDLTYSLHPGAPVGMTIDSNTGVLTWTPTAAQNGTTNGFTVRVRQNGSPPLEATETFSSIVIRSNSPPHLMPVPPLQAQAGVPIQVQLSATDPDLPTDTLRYWLGPGAPQGSALDPVTGVFTWTPGIGQIGTSVFQAVVSDSGRPPGSSAQAIAVVVSPTTPVISLHGEVQGALLMLRLSGTDGKHYQLESSLDLIHWTPLVQLDPGGTVQFATAADERQFFRAREL